MNGTRKNGNGYLPSNVPDLSKLQIKAQERVRLAAKCPNNCAPSMVMNAVSQDYNKNTCSRCLNCGLFWEVDKNNNVIKVKQWKNEQIIKEET